MELSLVAGMKVSCSKSVSVGVLVLPLVCTSVVWWHRQTGNCYYPLPSTAATSSSSQESCPQGHKLRRASPVPSPATALERAGSLAHLDSTTELTLV